MRQRLSQQVGTMNARHDLDLLTGRENDLGRLLADPRTQFVRLTAADDRSPVRFASAAWNQETQTGAVFCGDLAAGSDRHYQVWLVPNSGSATTVLLGPTESGRNIYLFSPARQAARPVELILTDDTRAALARGSFSRNN